MKQLSILIPSGQVGLSTIACVTGALDIFGAANRFAEQEGGEPRFRIVTVGASTEPVSLHGITLTPDAAAHSVARSHLVIVPSSLVRSYEEATPGNRVLIDWVAAQHRGGAEIASMCSGVFLLAATGLLEGRSCSTHWALSGQLEERYPGVEAATDKLITDEGGIYTNGGAYSFLHLVLYLVEKHYGRSAAIHCAKIFQVDMDRRGQSAFAIFSGHKKHADDLVLRAQQYLEDNYSEKISIESLSAHYHIGRRSFDRRFIRATGLTPLDYLQRVRVESAKKSLEGGHKTVSEIMYESGYNDTKAFREVFSRVTGVTPGDYKAKYSRTV